MILTNCRTIFNGTDISGKMNQVQVEYGAETDDNSVFLQTTRTKKGTVMTHRATASGFEDFGSGSIEEAMRSRVGVGGDVISLFPEDVVEGSTGVGSGLSFLVVSSQFNVGGAYGKLLPFTWSAEGQGAA